MSYNNILHTVDYLLERANNPLYNPLEAGFRHSPLSLKEKLERYEDFVMEVSSGLQHIMKNLPTKDD